MFPLTRVVTALAADRWIGPTDPAGGTPSGSRSLLTGDGFDKKICKVRTTEVSKNVVESDLIAASD